MYQINKPSLRTALLLGAATAAAVSLSIPASAAETVETVVVTGSRIPQQGLYATSPVTAVGQQEMKFEGTTNVESLINNLPSAFASFGDALSNGSTGTASVNLRGLGSARTLVLIDGRRLGPGSPVFPVADLNFIPAALVDHIEVLTGGASAVYGSDAVSGVVNFIMRKDFEGVEFDGQYGIDNHDNGNPVAQAALTTAAFHPANPTGSVTDGQKVDGTLILGTNSADGKGNVTAYISFRNAQSVLESSRDFSACAMNSSGLFGGATPFICSGSSNSAVGNIRTQNGATPPNTGTHGPFRTNTNGNLTPYVTANDAFNFAPLNYLRRPDNRYTAGFFAHYQVDKHFDFFADFMFMDDHNVAQIAPSGYFRGTAPAGQGGNFLVNCDNPFLGTTANPNSPESKFCALDGKSGAQTTKLQIGRRLVENGNRQDDLRFTDYRILAGVRGELAYGWNYELSAQYYQTILNEEYLNDASVAHEQRALLVVPDPRAGVHFGLPVCSSVLNGLDTSCVPLNIFTLGGGNTGPVFPYPNTVAGNAAAAADYANALQYVKGNGFREGGNQEEIVAFNVSGDFSSWGGKSPWAKDAIGASVGAEYRQESVDDRVDFEFSSGDLAGQGGPRPSVFGHYSVAEGYGEVRIPIVQDVPGFKDLTANAGYRYSDYNLAGGVSSYKYGLEWQIVDDVRLRGSYQRAVRAPNTTELFTPQAIGLFGGVDPCGSTATLTAAQCANTGLVGASAANYHTGNLDCPVGQCSGLFGGNTHLKPESADSWSGGIVFTPTFIPGFTMTLDYFRIKVKDAVGVIPQAGILTGCATTGNATLCALIHRDPVSGIIFGNSGFVDSTNQNTGFLKTDGIDVETNYQADLSDWGLSGWGSLAFNLLGTYTGSFTVAPLDHAFFIASGIGGDETYECSGRFGNVCGTPTPKWRHKLRTTWTAPDGEFDVSLSWRFMSSVSLDFNGTNTNFLIFGAPAGDGPDGKIGSYNYIDLAGTWNVAPGYELRAGVTNLFDKDPPILDSSYVAAPPFGNGNTYPQVYDSLGRVLFVGGTIKY